MADEDSKWASFKNLIGNKVVRPGEEGYDEARVVWNKDYNRFPYAITFPSTKEEVSHVLAFAKGINKTVSVRCGGHSRSSVIDDAIVIDLSKNMKNVTVDPLQKIARVQGGATLALLDEATAVHKLVVPAGQVSHTGVAGLTLQGGMGYVSRKFGYSCDNVLSYELVTANGEFITVSKDSHPDLFWALKGAGQNFGVVVEFTFQLHDLPEFTSGNIIYPFEPTFAKDCFKFMDEYMKTAPEEVSLYFTLLTIPGMGKVVNLDISYVGDVQSCEKALGPLLTYGNPIVKAIHPQEYVKKQKQLDEVTKYGQNCYFKDRFFDFSEDIIAEVVEHFNSAPLPRTVMQVMTMGGVTATTYKDNTAFPNRQNKYICASFMMYEDNEREQAFTWGRSGFYSQKFSGMYTSCEITTTKEASQITYGDLLPRLREIKKKYDPENVFRYSSSVVSVE
eukprot:TRINITY_DN356_c0_g2_i2.p1 TRINITY_DN356_c0_g2~~TRINITY_DN356_c0_g2_i2.p1  ORF type:complete len:456 (-),score=91.86 TRINITY_DN356_c0_g2_i2:192-1535(-)